MCSRRLPCVRQGRVADRAELLRLEQARGPRWLALLG